MVRVKHERDFRAAIFRSKSGKRRALAPASKRAARRVRLFLSILDSTLLTLNTTHA